MNPQSGGGGNLAQVPVTDAAENHPPASIVTEPSLLTGVTEEERRLSNQPVSFDPHRSEHTQFEHRGCACVCALPWNRRRSVNL